MATRFRETYPLCCQSTPRGRTVTLPLTRNTLRFLRATTLATNCSVIEVGTQSSGKVREQIYRAESGEPARREYRSGRRGGAIRTSVEAAVMAVERRGGVIWRCSTQRPKSISAGRNGVCDQSTSPGLWRPAQSGR